MASDIVFTRLSDDEIVSVDTCWTESSGCDVFYFGENHSRPDVLLAQIALLELMAGSGKLQLVLEMFNLDQQELIDEYARGDITFDELRDRYQQSHENFPILHYGELLTKARDLGVSVKAGFIPRTVASRVVREGLDSLDEYPLFPKKEFQEGHADHLEFFSSLIQDAAPMMTRGIDIERFFMAQLAKDSAMAMQVDKVLASNSGTKVLVITGSGHVEFGWGVPERVLERAKKRGASISHAIITTYDQEKKPQEFKKLKPADYAFLSRPMYVL